MIKVLLRKIAYKIYSIGKVQSDLKESEKKRVLPPLNYILGEDTLLDANSYIQNSREKDKITIGSRNHIKGHLMTFKHQGEIVIGDDCFVGEHTKIWSAKRIVIGNRVLISHNVNIHDNISHPLNSKERHEDFVYIFSTGQFRKENNLREAEIFIEDDVWIGFNSTIMKGVRIGRGAIIGACTLINKDVPSFAVVVGNPARIVKYVD